jgi:hypothetical protein
MSNDVRLAKLHASHKEAMGSEASSQLDVAHSMSRNQCAFSGAESHFAMRFRVTSSMIGCDHLGR